MSSQELTACPAGPDDAAIRLVDVKASGGEFFHDVSGNSKLVIEG